MMRSPVLLLVLFIVSGCAGMLPDLVGDPPSLYELRAPDNVLSTLPISTRQLLVDVPVASAGIDTPRMALRQADGTMAYYKDVSWTDRAPVMYQTLIVNAFSRSGKLPAVGRDNVGLRADYLLKTDLADFQADYSAGAPPVVTVTLEAKLISMPRRTILTGQRFSARVTARSDDISSVASAFQKASDEAVIQLVDWTLVRLQKSGRRD